MKPYKDKLLAFLDVETTGLNSNDHEIIEFGLIVYDRQRDVVLKEWESKVKPRHLHTASQAALRINGYSNNPKLYKNNIRTAIVKLNNYAADCILIGQNVSFDIGFVNQYLDEFDIRPKFDRRSIDILSLAWGAVCDRDDLGGLSLKDLCNHFGISNEGAHGALVDCRRALGTYKCVMNHYRKIQ